MTLPRIMLKPRRAKPFFAGHPWLFAGAIDRLEGKPEPGAVVDVRSDKGEFIAYGLFNPKSSIAVRLYSWKEDEFPNDEFFVRRVKEAVAFRHDVLGLADPEGGCRLVFGEGDGLSGLVADRWADVVVMQIGSRALASFEPAIVTALQESLSPRAIYRTVDAGIAELEGMEPASGWLAGEPIIEPIPFVESGVLFLVDPAHGQKTGAYHDQRDNRLAVARYARGREVLDIFSYTGGFGLVAAKVGSAGPITAIDSSEPALELAKRNAKRNGVPLTTMPGDATVTMTHMLRAGRTFGLVVCDPPKFAARKADVDSALSGYQYVNRLAMGLVEPGGILATFSCSGHVSTEMFLAVLTDAAQKAKREIRILETRGHAPDHPIALACPESAYLKGVIARVV